MRTLAFTVCVTLAAPVSAIAQVPSTSLGARVDPELRDALSRSPDGWAPAIVVLVEPRLVSGASWDARRAAVRRRQEEVLTRLTGGDFRPAYRCRNFAVLTGQVSAAGLETLALLPAVESVDANTRGELDGEGRVPPDGGGGAEPLPNPAADLTGVTAVRRDLGLTGRGYAIAVVDSGIDSGHPDLADSVLPGGITMAGATMVSGAGDDHGHGTAVAGVITGNGGVAPEGVAPAAGILPIKVFKADGTQSGDIVAALDYVISLKSGGDPPHAGLIGINMSLRLGSASSSCPCADGSGLARAVAAARDARLAVVASGGNDLTCDATGYPACLPHAIAAGGVHYRAWGALTFDFGTPCTDSTTAADQIPCYSNTGACMDVHAPVGVFTTALGGGTTDFWGTSAAAPHVAGVVALLQEAAGGTLWPEEIETILRETAVRIPARCDSTASAPRLDALAAAEIVLGRGVDCDANGIADLLDLARGTAPDCNSNHVPDSCDLASGASPDCDSNGIPDECDADCDHDLVPDACALAAGDVPDCNQNGLPDACDVLPAGQSFAPARDAVVAVAAADAVALDLQGDLLLDLVVTLPTTQGALKSYTALAGGGYAAAVSFPAGGPRPTRLGHGDLDADGREDLAVAHAGTLASPGTTLGVLRGAPDGAFEPVSVLTAGTLPADLTVVDLDGDGRPDLVSANTRSKDATVLRNRTSPDGPLEFAPAVGYPAGDSPGDLVASDLDLDGDVDLLVANTSAKDVRRLLNDGDAAFSEAGGAALPVAPLAIAAGDLTGDGRLDLAAVGSGSEHLLLLEGAADGAFGAPLELEIEILPAIAEPSDLALLDADGDRVLDVIVSLRNLAAVSYLEGQGGGRFALPRLLALGTGARPTRLVLADLEGDGDPDVEALSPGSTKIHELRNDRVPPASRDADQDGVPDECRPPAPRFRRGDTNDDAAFDLSDAVATLGFLFLGSAAPACLDAADVNDSGSLDLSDAVYTLGFLFLGTAPPPAPFEACGVDPTTDSLACQAGDGEGSPSPCP